MYVQTYIYVNIVCCIYKCEALLKAVNLSLFSFALICAVTSRLIALALLYCIRIAKLSCLARFKPGSMVLDLALKRLKLA